MRRSVASPTRLEGELEVPGDKSISHRALLLNALAEGTARLRNLGPGEDVQATLRCLQALGVPIRPEADGALRVEGTGGRLREPPQVLSCGQSGTTMRLLAGVCAGQPFLSVLTGHPQLLRRPMARIARPLQAMGALVLGRAGDTLPPLAIRGGRLRGLRHDLPVASAQVKSCLLLAGLFAEGETAVREPAPSRDHTERMMQAMGANLERGEDGTVCLRPGPLRALDLEVPGDFSSGAFWLVAGLIHPQARITVRGVGLNPTRTGLLDALRTMGARLQVRVRGERAGEPVGDITAESSDLRGTEVGGDLLPRLIDEVPALAVAGCFAHGTTVIREAGELRVKESDRITALARELTRLGARVEERPDGLVVHGGAPMQGTTVRSHGDHRIAMALAVAGLALPGETVVLGAECVAKSYPSFWEDLERLTRAE